MKSCETRVLAGLCACGIFMVSFICAEELLVKKEVDGNKDGIMDVEEYYDPNSRLVERRWDLHTEGVPQKSMKFFYNDKDVLEKGIGDTNNDGKPDIWIEYKDKAISSLQRDADFDEKVDFWGTYLSGKISKAEIDTNKDAKPDKWISYDQQGKATKREDDENFDGKVDKVVDIPNPVKDVKVIQNTKQTDKEQKEK